MLLAVLAALAGAGLAADARVPASLFGQNVEHTRMAVSGGLSAELVRNRKFPGKPDHDGIAAEWRAFGTRAVYDLLMEDGAYVRHVRASAMPRRNELGAQKITSLVEDGFAGIAQEGLPLRGGTRYRFKANVRGEFDGDAVRWRFRIVNGTREALAEGEGVSSGRKWTALALDFTSRLDEDVRLEIGLLGRASGVVGTVSLLPGDNFCGMRQDVVAALKDIGTSIIRWPGGNFAGEYRWRDGTLDRDERAPIQSYMEAETQPYTGGYDMNDIGTDEILALCREIGAKPFFTVNLAWETPEDSADWVRHCRGEVLNWSLGNEFGYAHMEGPRTPGEYAGLAREHGRAMKAVEPELDFVSSGHYPAEADSWLEGAGRPLSDMAPCISVHHYTRVPVDYSSAQRVEETARRVLSDVDAFFLRLREMRRRMPEGMTISLDEWNLWYAWFGEDGGLHGVYAMKFLHRLMTEWRRLGISDACMFQAINEGAMRVGPHSVRLTATGEALRLAKGHVGGEVLKGLPEEDFGTVRPDGGLYFTVFNPSPTTTRDVLIPVGSGKEIIDSEELSVTDPFPGTRYVRGALSVRNVAAGLIVQLKPFSIASIKLHRIED